MPFSEIKKISLALARVSAEGRRTTSLSFIQIIAFVGGGIAGQASGSNFQLFEPHDHGRNKMVSGSPCPQRRSIAYFTNISLTPATNSLDFQSFKIQLSTHRIQVIECI
jgi:hypothetical protein